jgi:hypothetical protein
MYAKGWQEFYVHLWFLGHLLLYSALYAGWRLLVRRGGGPGQAEAGKRVSVRLALVLNVLLVIYAIALAGVTYAVRVNYPLDRWRPLLFILPVEYAHLPQYVSLFVLGAVAYRGNWLRRFPTWIGLAWLAIGLAAVMMYYLRDLGLVRFLPGVRLATGGKSRGSLVFSAWEALVCTGLCVGLPVLYRTLLAARRTWRPGRIFSAAIGAQYAAYILHVPVVIGVQAALLPLGWPRVAWQPLIKFVIVTLAGSALSFGIGYLLKRIPGAERVL